ncbi:hypothetical protein KR038_002915 [Drosophila bunnanda]|nr:hypothetical protein KR038_002915 [Drosophila bunnanda]
MKLTSPTEATTSSSNSIMFSRQCLSHPTRSPTTASAQGRSRPPSTRSTAPMASTRWTLSLWALMIASGCSMLNTPTAAAFDIGKWKGEMN